MRFLISVNLKNPHSKYVMRRMAALCARVRCPRIMHEPTSWFKWEQMRGKMLFSRMLVAWAWVPAIQFKMSRAKIWAASWLLVPSTCVCWIATLSNRSWNSQEYRRNGLSTLWEKSLMSICHFQHKKAPNSFFSFWCLPGSIIHPKPYQIKKNNLPINLIIWFLKFSDCDGNFC